MKRGVEQVIGFLSRGHLYSHDVDGNIDSPRPGAQSTEVGVTYTGAKCCFLEGFGNCA